MPARIKVISWDGQRIEDQKEGSSLDRSGEANIYERGELEPCPSCVAVGSSDMLSMLWGEGKKGATVHKGLRSADAEGQTAFSMG